MHENAFAIAAALTGHAARVSVVACTDEPLAHDPALEVFLLDNSCYFGRQFEKTIEVFDGDILLQIAADTTTASWGALAQQCAQRFQANPILGVWTPRHRRHHLAERAGDALPDPGPHPDRRRADRLHRLGDAKIDRGVSENTGLFATPLGWGIDWAAIAHAHANK